MTNQKKQSEARANYVTLVRAVGAGFHPDSQGHDYVSLPDEFDADAVDVIVDMAFDDASIDDPYALAIRALDDSTVPLPFGEGDYECSACREEFCVGECIY